MRDALTLTVQLRVCLVAWHVRRRTPAADVDTDSNGELTEAEVEAFLMKNAAMLKMLFGDDKARCSQIIIFYYIMAKFKTSTNYNHNNHKLLTSLPFYLF